MNTLNVLNNGHDAILKAAQGLTETDWYTPAVYGHASTRDILAQAVCFEYVLMEVLGSFLDNRPTPTLNALLAGYEVFMAVAVPQQEKTLHELWAAYEVAHAQTVMLLAQIPPETRRQKGTLPWYGMDFTLHDFIAYTFFGTKHKWSAQLRAVHNQRAPKRVQDIA